YFFFLGMEDMIVCLYKKPNALCRLICFLWAGGEVSQLAEWGKLFSSSIEVVSVNLTEKKSHENGPLEKDLITIADEMTSVLLEYFQEKPFAIFGHSFGTHTAFAFALQMKEKYGLEPIHLFVSAAYAPHSEAFIHLKSIAICDADNEELATYITLLGGNNTDLLQNEDIKKCATQNFREDFRLLQSLSFKKTENNIPFSCDITCFAGSEDRYYDLKAWHELTSGATSFYQLPGGHFYLLDPPNQTFLVKYITSYMENADL
ncbi:SAST synthase, partial [Alcedo cyanopectus]|nr:SAST synthase [Ceyx cyanopectus]